MARNEVPDTRRDYPMQEKAIHDAGFSTATASVNEYRRLVVSMSYKEREPYFFLRANDLFFRPWINPHDTDFNFKLSHKTEGMMAITDWPVEDKQGYFIVAAPST